MEDFELRDKKELEVSEDLKVCRFCKHLCTDIANQVDCDLNLGTYLDDYYCDRFELNEILKKHIYK